jgi:pantetheine-phosphate adenylyltransferase
MVSCVFPGSFDPVTKGHMDVIRRASAMFDHVTVIVMLNIHKSGLFPVQQRIAFLRKACSSLDNVSVESWEGLLADYMCEKQEKIILRGVRSGTELDSELQSACANHLLNNQTETVFIHSDPCLTGVSSSAVREIAAFGGNIRPFVPETIAKEIADFVSKQKEQE